MALRYLKTAFHLPPGIPRTSTVRDLVHRFFSGYRWFQPVRFGEFDMAERLEPGRFDPAGVAAGGGEVGGFRLGAQTGGAFLMLFPRTEGR